MRERKKSLKACLKNAQTLYAADVRRRKSARFGQFPNRLLRQHSPGMDRRSGNMLAEALDDANVLLQGARLIVAIPGDAIIGLDRRAKVTKNHAGVREVFDLLPGQRDAQALGDEAHQAGLEVRVLQDSRSKARRLAYFRKPFAKARVGLFRHAHKKHRFKVSKTYFRLFRHRG